jgi:hypothetical protein
MAGTFCQRCFDRMVVAFRKRHGDDPTLSIDPKGANFACKIPIYESDGQGRPTVKIWDCASQITRIHTQEAWERMKRDGLV